MAKLPKKIAPSQKASETTLRDFVSSAALKPNSASSVHRVNMSLTDDDMSKSEIFQDHLNLSRVEIFRAGLLALAEIEENERQRIAAEVRRSSPKAGRPPVNK